MLATLLVSALALGCKCCESPRCAQDPGSPRQPAGEQDAEHPGRKNPGDAGGPSQDAAPAPQTLDRFVDDSQRFALRLPAGWRRMTPDEGRSLRAGGRTQVPAEFLEPEPPRYLVFGPIDRWLAGTFDGRALTLAESDGEPDVGPSGIADVKAHWESVTQRGTTVVVERLEVGSVGTEAHPALLGRLRVGAGTDAHTRFDAYVPSGGQTYCFALTWPAADAAAGEAEFTAMCRSIGMASKARGPVHFGSKLLWAALFGLGIGVVLHSVRKRARG